MAPATTLTIYLFLPNLGHLYEVFSHTFKIRVKKKQTRTLRLFKVPTKKIILEGPKLVS